jgi:hypothetical protein
MIDVIGAGFGRTGTLSLKAALELLGFAPCYHMYELLGHLDHAPHWNAANAGDADSLRTPLEGYRATVDWPGCVLWRELCDTYPDAKVVLSVRPAERWYASFRETVGALVGRGMPPGMPDQFLPMARVAEEIVRERSFGADFDLDDADRIIAAYEAHNAAVRAGVPAARLLVFDVAEGWEPLCAFLGAPVPDAEFPNVNDREQFKLLFGMNEPEEVGSVTEERVLEMQERFRGAAATPSAPGAPADRAPAPPTT